MSNDSEEFMMGHHEEFDWGDEEVTEQDPASNCRETHSHLMWHCLMYRRALERVPNGYQTLRAVLSEAKDENSNFCTSCEMDQLHEKMKHMGVLELSADENLPAEQTEDGCSNCTIDARICTIEAVKEKRSDSPIIETKKLTIRRTSL